MTAACVHAIHLRTVAAMDTTSLEFSMNHFHLLLLTVYCSDVTLDETQSAILAVDPAISPKEVARVLAAVFGVDPDQLAEASASTVPHSEVVKRLSQSGLQHLRQ